MKKNIIVTVSGLLLIFMLSACTSTCGVSRLSSSSAKSDCQQLCWKKMKSCKQSCKNNCQNCRRTADTAALNAFQAYAHEQEIKGGVIAREASSYRDPLRCTKVSCNCCADLNVCLQSCQGYIKKQLTVPRHCA